MPRLSQSTLDNIKQGCEAVGYTDVTIMESSNSRGNRTVTVNGWHKGERTGIGYEWGNMPEEELVTALVNEMHTRRDQPFDVFGFAAQAVAATSLERTLERAVEAAGKHLGYQEMRVRCTDGKLAFAGTVQGAPVAFEHTWKGETGTAVATAIADLLKSHVPPTPIPAPMPPREIGLVPMPTPSDAVLAKIRQECENMGYEQVNVQCTGAGDHFHVFTMGVHKGDYIGHVRALPRRASPAAKLGDSALVSLIAVEMKKQRDRFVDPTLFTPVANQPHTYNLKSHGAKLGYTDMLSVCWDTGAMQYMDFTGILSDQRVPFRYSWNCRSDVERYIVTLLVAGARNVLPRKIALTSPLLTPSGRVIEAIKQACEEMGYKQVTTTCTRETSYLHVFTMGMLDGVRVGYALERPLQSTPELYADPAFVESTVMGMQAQRRLPMDPNLTRTALCENGFGRIIENVGRDMGYTDTHSVYVPTGRNAHLGFTGLMNGEIRVFRYQCAEQSTDKAAQDIRKMMLANYDEDMLNRRCMNMITTAGKSLGCTDLVVSASTPGSTFKGSVLVDGERVPFVCSWNGTSDAEFTAMITDMLHKLEPVPTTTPAPLPPPPMPEEKKPKPSEVTVTNAAALKKQMNNRPELDEARGCRNCDFMYTDTLPYATHVELCELIKPTERLYTHLSTTNDLRVLMGILGLHAFWDTMDITLDPDDKFDYEDAIWLRDYYKRTARKESFTYHGLIAIVHDELRTQFGLDLDVTQSSEHMDDDSDSTVVSLAILPVSHKHCLLNLVKQRAANQTKLTTKQSAARDASRAEWDLILGKDA